MSLNNYLRDLSYRYYLKSSALETRNIDASVKALISKAKHHFGEQLKAIQVFGSYDRDTILPRKYDSYSDVDILFTFNSSQYDRTPDTYRTWLQKFAETHYKPFETYKSFPTVVVQRDHIAFDLVPSKQEESFWGNNRHYIPDSSGGWMQTDPFGFKKQLAEANQSYNNIVKPIIRLLKAWNANANYPFASYMVETFVARQNFSGDDIYTGLLYAIEQTELTGTQSQNKKIESLKTAGKRVEEYIRRGEMEKAKSWLHKAFPR
ncbi:MAG: hypothetical protein SFW35_02950 [Chitinophagales bacterium]|nr:hypothetical protein [Chitinophagales bacterium]